MLKVNRSSAFPGRAADQSAFLASGSIAGEEYGGGEHMDGNSTYLFLQLKENAGASLEEGWTFVRDVFQTFQGIPDNQRTGASGSVHEWVLQTSRAASKNLVQFFTTWKWTVPAATTAAVADENLGTFSFNPMSQCGAICSNCCVSDATVLLGDYSGSGDSGSTSTAVSYTNILQQHNDYRAAHSAPALAWSEALATQAAQYAASCNYQHDTANTVDGENLYAISAGFSTQEALDRATPAWYSEISLYDFAAPGFSNPTGHFTQVSACMNVDCNLLFCTSKVKSKSRRLACWAGFTSQHKLLPLLLQVLPLAACCTVHAHDTTTALPCPCRWCGRRPRRWAAPSKSVPMD